MNTKGRKINKDGDQVEQLLQAAQDDLLLRLSVDSYMSRVPPDCLLPDLDRRFQALKSRPSSIPNTNQSSTSTKSQPPPDADHILARFDALKASSSNITATNRADAGFGGNSDDEEDEVEKILQWAKDAARLDPSPPSDDDDDDSTYGEDEVKKRGEGNKTKRY